MLDAIKDEDIENARTCSDIDELIKEIRFVRGYTKDEGRKIELDAFIGTLIQRKADVGCS